MFTWTPTEAQGPGSYGFDVVVTDNTALSDSESITVTVNEVNQPPVLAGIGDQTVDEQVELTFTASATDNDLPANTLSFTLVGEPAGASIDPVSGAFTWTPTEAQGPGSYTFDVVVTDDGTPTLSDSETITVTVDEVNVAPVLDPVGDQTIDEGVELTFAATATDPDVPSTLSFTLTGAPAGASIDPVSGVFTWTPSEAQGPGSYPFDIVVTDDGTPTLTDSETITVTVDEVNVAPTVTDPGDQTDPEGAVVSLFITATDSDLPANTLSYAASGLPAGLGIDPVSGEIAGTLSFGCAATSPHTVTVTVTDNGTPILSGQTVFDWTCTPVNQPPTLDPVGDHTINEQTLLTFTATATDPNPGDTLSFTLAGAVPAGAVIDPLSGVFTWTPTETQGPGSYTFDVVVTDNGTPAVSDSETITVTVDEVNTPPVLAGIGNQTVDEGVELTFTATASDPDAPSTLTYTLTGAPAGASIDPVRGVHLDPHRDPRPRQLWV